MHQCQSRLLKILGGIVEVGKLFVTVVRAHLSGLAIRKRERPHEGCVSGVARSDVARFIFVFPGEEDGPRLLDARRRVDRERTNRRCCAGPFEHEVRRGGAGLSPIDELAHESILTCEHGLDDRYGPIARTDAAVKLIACLEPLVRIIEEGAR